MCAQLLESMLRPTVGCFLHKARIFSSTSGPARDIVPYGPGGAKLQFLLLRFCRQPACVSSVRMLPWKVCCQKHTANSNSMVSRLFAGALKSIEALC